MVIAVLLKLKTHHPSFSFLLMIEVSPFRRATKIALSIIDDG